MFTCAAVLPALLLAGRPALAGTDTWQGNGTTTNWSDAANWSPAAVPSNNDDIVLSQSGSNAPSNFNINVTANSLTINQASNSTTLLNGYVVANAGGYTFGLAGGGTITDNAGYYAPDQLNMGIALGGAATVKVTNGGDILEIGGAGISGTGSLTKTGNGILELTAASSYSGSTTVSSGHLQLNVANAISSTSDVAVASGAELDLNNNNETFGSLSGAGDIETGYGSGGTITVGGNNTSTTFSGAINGAGGLTKTGTGTLTLSGSNTYYGTTTVAAGTLQVYAIGRVTDNATLAFISSNTTSAGSISGSGVVEQLGTGILVLDQASTYSGGTIIGAGTVYVNDDSGLGTGNVTLTNGGTLEVTGNGALSHNVVLGTGGGTLTSNGSELTLSGTISGTGAVTFNSTETYITGTSTYSGATMLKSGILYAGSTTALSSGSDYTMSAGTELFLGSSNNSIGSLSGSGSIQSYGAVLTTNGDNASTTYSGSIQTGLTKAGTGTLTLTGTNTAYPATTVSAGTLQAGATNTFSPNSSMNVASGATLDLNSFNQAIGSLAGAGNVTLGSATLTAGGNNNSTVFSGVVSGTGALTKAGTGTLTLAGANTYTGGTTVSAGTLQLGNGGSSGSIVGDITDNGVVAFDRSDAPVFSHVISGTGAVDITGSGTIVFTGSNTYSGGTTIASGTLALGNGGTSGWISGNVTDNGTLVFDRSDNISFAGAVSGSGGITLEGSGIVTLGAANTYSGATDISAGTLQAGVNAAFSPNSAVTVESGATLDLNNYTAAIGSLAGAGNVTLGIGTLTANGNNTSTTFSGAISGTGGLTKAGTGTLTLGSANTYTGVTKHQRRNT